MIVWTRSPDTAVSFDETFTSDDSMKILIQAPIAKGGRFPTVIFSASKRLAEGGCFRLFLTNKLRKKNMAKNNETVPFEIREITVGTRSCDTVTEDSLAGCYASLFTMRKVMPIQIEASDDWAFFTVKRCADDSMLPGPPSALPGQAPSSLGQAPSSSDQALNAMLALMDENEGVTFIVPKGGSSGFRGIMTSSTATVLSAGKIWIVLSVAAASAVCVAILGIMKKKKRPATASDAESTDEA